MTLSIWRYCHLILAIACSLFLLTASVTGVILAVEPISHQAKGYAVQDLDKVSLATAITGLRENYDEVFSMEVEPSGFVKASVLTTDFETKTLYIDPKTGKELGEVPPRPSIYSFATNLHRSLFLKGIGRFFVGLVSLLLFLITVTGIFLLAKRQGGIKRLFSKVHKDYFEQRYHVILSRWFFIPLVILALTGVYLSAEKFDLLPSTALEFKDQLPPGEKGTTFSEQSIFTKTMLDEVRRVDFPFADDPEEYYQIALTGREMRVNQQTGEILSSAAYPFVTIASRFSLMMHTGSGSVLWSIVLLLASASILFFMYSGFVMTLRRRKKTPVTTVMPDKDECEYVILVGSETGTTFDFARRLFNALTKAGKKTFMTELNSYSAFAPARPNLGEGGKAKHIIILTATYGEGEPPTNARKFETLFPNIIQPNKVNYSVLGFGSLEYPDYCRFAVEVDKLLQENDQFQSVLPLYKINNSNNTAFEDWAKKWSTKLDLPLRLERPSKKRKKLKQIAFEVTELSALNADDTFLLRLKPKRKVKFTSGDLLSILPEGVDVARQYSIAKMGDEILLSIKKHEFGRTSSYLFSLNTGAIVHAAVEANPQFHFPKKENPTILIANGTGIAPFLGMLNENKKSEIQLFWGGRTEDSSELYEPILQNGISKCPNITIHKCFSRTENKKYVQDMVAERKEHILNTLEAGGTLMLCGSLAMQHGVLDTLEKLLQEHPGLHLDEVRFKEQLKMDCY